MQRDGKTIDPDAGAGQRFTRGSWLALLFSLVLVLLTIFQTVYRFRVPTDGWIWYTGAFGTEEEAFLFYQTNLVGQPSPLRQGDQVTAIAGIATAGDTFSYNSQAAERLAGLEAGDRLTYAILRDGQPMEIDVLLTHWTLAAWLRLNLELGSVLTFLSSLVMYGVGLFTLLKRPALPSARALLLWATANFCLVISNTLPDNLFNVLYPIAAMGTLLFSYSIFIWLLSPSLFFFTLVFPRPKGFIQRHPWMALIPYVFGAGILGLILVDVRLGVLGWLGTVTLFILSGISLIHSVFTQRDAVSRAQLRWAVMGVFFGILVSLPTYLPAFGILEEGQLGYILSLGVDFGLAIVGFSLSIAILRYRLWDIDFIIRRTLIYSSLTITLALVYFACVVLIESIVRSMTGEAEHSQVAIVISTLGIAALFSPLRRRIQHAIDGRFFRQAYNTEHTLQDFAATLRNEINMDQLTGHLVNVVERTVQPNQVSLWVRKREGK